MASRHPTVKRISHRFSRTNRTRPHHHTLAGERLTTRDKESHPGRFSKRHRRLELRSSAWKADVLANWTNVAFCARIVPCPTTHRYRPLVVNTSRHISCRKAQPPYCRDEGLSSESNVHSTGDGRNRTDNTLLARKCRLPLEHAPPRSRWQELNPQPPIYKNVALPG